MNLTRMLDRIRAAGVHLDVRSDELGCEAPSGVMTPRGLAWLERYKVEMLQLLQPKARADDPAERHNWGQRAEARAITGMPQA